MMSDGLLAPRNSRTPRQSSNQSPSSSWPGWPFVHPCLSLSRPPPHTARRNDRQNNYAQKKHELTHANLKGRCVGLFTSQRLPEVFGHVNDLFRLAEGQLVVVELKLALRRRSHPSSACFRGPNQYAAFAPSQKIAPYSSCTRMRALWREGGGAALAKLAAAELPAATIAAESSKKKAVPRSKQASAP